MKTLPFPGESPYPRELFLWEPAGAPLGLAVISHGMAEHIGRYRRLGEALSGAGFAVAGYNHLGHGDEAALKGYFADRDGWGRAVEDIHSVLIWMKARFPGVPAALIGHSMGSFLAREYALRHPDVPDALVLSGTGWQPPALCGFGLMAAEIVCALGGARRASRFLDKLAFSANNKPFRPARTPFDWLSRDEAEVDKYAADPLCGFVFTGGGFRDMFRGLAALTRLERLAALPGELPVLLISGERDPVGAQGRGVRIVAGQYRKAGLSRVDLRLYEGARHELFNETNREDVTLELIRWLDAALARRKENPQ